MDDVNKSEERQRLIKLHDDICEYWTVKHGSNNDTTVRDLVGSIFDAIVNLNDSRSSKKFRNKIGLATPKRKTAPAFAEDTDDE